MTLLPAYRGERWRLVGLAGLALLLPVLIRRLSLDRLVRLIDPGVAPGVATPGRAAIERQAGLVRAVLRRLGGRQDCLPRSLLLFRQLRRRGAPVSIHFGIARRGGGLDGHCWLQLDGVPIAEPGDPRSRFRTIYAYPPPSLSRADGSPPGAGGDGSAAGRPRVERGRYRLHGLTIDVEVGSPALVRPVHAIFDYFGLVTDGRERDGAARADLELRFEAAGALPPAALWRASPMRFGEVELGPAADGVLSVRSRCAQAALDPAAGLARMTVTPAFGSGSGPLGEAQIVPVLLALGVLLRERGLYDLHGAALAWRGRGLLLTGDGGCGKSTLALALLRQGFALVSDDSLLLRGGRGPVQALALRRDLYLDADGAARFPDLAGAWRSCPLTAAAKRRLDAGVSFPGRAAAACVPRLVVFPRIVDAGRSRLLAVAPAAALGRLLAQSKLLTATPEKASAHLSALTRLVRQARCVVLQAGRDLAAAPGRAAVLLRPQLETEEGGGHGVA